MEIWDYEKKVQHKFESYCKKVVKRKLFDIYRQVKRRSKHEVVFSDVPEQELLKIAVTDEYLKNEHTFNVLGEFVGVSDADVAEALHTLAPVCPYGLAGQKNRQKTKETKTYAKIL